MRTSTGDEGLPDCRGYELLVTGHSLGAGTAVLLAMLLRPRYPKVHCLGYGCPHVCSRFLAERCGKHTVPVVLGDDVIPRLSIRNAELMRDRMLALAAHCPMPKHVILKRGLRETWASPLDRLFDAAPVSDVARASLSAHAGKPASPKFYHAGKLCYLRVIETATDCFGTLVNDVGYRAEWAVSDDLMEMLISRKMIIQHMPDHYRAGLEGALATLEGRDDHNSRRPTSPDQGSLEHPQRAPHPLCVGH